MSARRNVIALAAVAVLGTSLLAACSSGSSSTDTSASASASDTVATDMPSDSASPSDGTIVGGDPSTWTPVSITQSMNGQKVKLVVGQAAVFTDLPPTDKANVIVVHAKKKGVVKVTQQTANGNAGISGLAPGRTKITVWNGKPSSKGAQVVMTITVRVNPYVPGSAAPSASASTG